MRKCKSKSTTVRVFLGGTCNNSAWRNDFIELIKDLPIDYFNPIVEKWDEIAKKNELFERKRCDFNLYVITPKMTGVYSIAEVVDDSNKRPEKTIFTILKEYDDTKFNDKQWSSLQSVCSLVKRNGGKHLNLYNLV